jgi:DNA modification methylase
MACETMGRRARLMELDQRYVDVIVKRWQDYTGRKAVLENDGREFEQIAIERSRRNRDGRMAVRLRAIF